MQVQLSLYIGRTGKDVFWKREISVQITGQIKEIPLYSILCELMKKENLLQGITLRRLGSGI